MNITENKTVILQHLSTIHNFLSKAYWCEGISKELIQKAIENSLSFAIIVDEQLVGFARVITDKATFAYLADVFIVDSQRGKGLSIKLMDYIQAHPDLQGLRRFMLATRDAHGLYEKYDFMPVEDAKPFMQINVPGIYMKAG
ncbi:GNAT family N-acetyltransferase [Pseudoalteromonas xiamenensis]|uniref:GNAT family N-acetyltransferase n=1 Tax=Pseudoalteromonas xiamenensis TaxID=882626 RepID=UPI0027E4234C|nr:GNAT family N-acetyltransferase [Pseudoalteromonas xiamenensis]WMN60142.1 GNAT family N-acetyltransferase [Pseudoalteromonas xiamenensis]